MSIRARGAIECLVALSWREWLRTLFTGRCVVTIPIEVARSMLADFERVTAAVDAEPNG